MGKPPVAPGRERFKRQTALALDTPRPVLDRRKSFVVGIANESSIAYVCAKAFRELGAELAIIYLNE